MIVDVLQSIRPLPPCTIAIIDGLNERHDEATQHLSQRFSDYVLCKKTEDGCTAVTTVVCPYVFQDLLACISVEDRFPSLSLILRRHLGRLFLDQWITRTVRSTASVASTSVGLRCWRTTRKSEYLYY